MQMELARRRLAARRERVTAGVSADQENSTDGQIIRLAAASSLCYSVAIPNHQRNCL